MTPTATQVSFLRALKGAPASILMALLLTGRAHTQRELQLITGYSDKPVSEGLALLQLAGVVRQGAGGWILTARPEDLTHLFSGEPAGDPPPLSTARNISDPYSTATLNNPIQDDDPVAASTYPHQPHSPRPGPVDNSANPVDNDHIPPSTVPGLPSLVPGQRSSVPGPPSPVPGQRSAVPGPPSAEIRAWLERAGVGSNSPKMRKLLSAGLSARYVQAHVLEREYRLRWKLVKPAEYQVGLLIRRLEDGDPAPPLRCPVCLEKVPCRC